jgi:hypothetical protein
VTEHAAAADTRLAAAANASEAALSQLRSQLAAAETALADANEAGASVCGCGWMAGDDLAPHRKQKRNVRV